MRVKINLDTMTAINDFVKAVTNYGGNVYLTDKERIASALCEIMA